MMDHNDLKIAFFSKEDWPKIAAIYTEGIATGIATFETKTPSWKDWDNTHLQPCRLKISYNKKIIGWAALAPVSKRTVYLGVAEVSIYLTTRARHKGIGYKLLTTLIRESEKAKFWTLQASIFSENRASIALHQKAGFRILGIREKIGQLGNVWKDNTLMEYRSRSNGQ